MIYTGINGTKYETIEPFIGKGGEGFIYRLRGHYGSVLKVFLDSKRTESRHRKLLTMVNSPISKKALEQITWPTDVVYDSNKKFVGYVMPEIKNNENLNVMYSDKYNCTFSQRITIAKNLCAAINSVHNAGQVCGDLNPMNIGVDPLGAKVTLVDTDSYHITDSKNNRTYRCEVGMPEYLPPEVQIKMKNGCNLSNAPLPTFTKESDLFALAIHIFALLMNGCHPFACAVDLSISRASVVQPQPIENIRNGFFPFYTKRIGINIPKYAPDFSILPKEIQALFIRAFVKGNSDSTQRPDAVEWYNALTVMAKNLNTCKSNESHIYPNHLKKCPWCELDKKMSSISASVMKNNQTAPQQVLHQTKTTISVAKKNTSQTNTPIASTNNSKSFSYSTTPQKNSLGLTNKLKKYKSWAKPIGWIVYIASVVAVFSPYIENGTVPIYDTQKINIVVTNTFAFLGIAIICFCYGLVDGMSFFPVPLIPGTACSIYGFFAGYFHNNNDKLLAIGIYQLLFFLTIIISMKLGEIISDTTGFKRQIVSIFSRPFKNPFTTSEIVFMIISLLPCFILLPMFINVEFFYTFCAKSNYIVIMMWVIPVVLYILYLHMLNNQKVNTNIEACFLASLVTFFQSIMLWSRVREYAILWFVALFIVGIVLLWFFYVEDIAFYPLATVLLLIVFFVGIFADGSVASEIKTISNGTRFFFILPSGLMTMVATGSTIKTTITNR